MVFLKIKEISSRQNPTVLWAASLAEKKYRERHEAFLVEGVKLVCEALSLGLPVTHIFVSESKKSAVFSVLEERGCLACLESEALEVYTLSDACFEKISTEKAPQGIIAAVKYLDFFVRTDKINKDDVGARALFLSSVRDPGNLGAIVRSAVAFGVDTLILSEDSADLYHPRVLRAAMGSLFRVRAITVQNERGAVEQLRALGRRVFAAELREHALPIHAIGVQGSDVFVIGNEGHGLSAALSAACDGSVYLPIVNGVESLNASVAASVLLWEQFRCE